jgi:hypothetical protein
MHWGRHRAFFDRLSMREVFRAISAAAIKKCPHPEPVEGRTGLIQPSIKTRASGFKI